MFKLPLNQILLSIPYSNLFKLQLGSTRCRPVDVASSFGIRTLQHAAIGGRWPNANVIRELEVPMIQSFKIPDEVKRLSLAGHVRTQNPSFKRLLTHIPSVYQFPYTSVMAKRNLQIAGYQGALRQLVSWARSGYDVCACRTARWLVTQAGAEAFLDKREWPHQMGYKGRYSSQNFNHNFHM
eukprot:Gb_23512 [translate_table: standard]